MAALGLRKLLVDCQICVWIGLRPATQELEHWESSQKAYESALSKLSADNLSSAEQLQKGNYERAIALAKKKQEPAPHKGIVFKQGATKKKCWESAREFLLKIQSEGRDEEVVYSSVRYRLLSLMLRKKAKPLF